MAYVALFNNPEVPDMRVREKTGLETRFFLEIQDVRGTSESQLWEQQGLLVLLFVEAASLFEKARPVQ